MDYSLYRFINGLSGHSAVLDRIGRLLAEELAVLIVLLIAALFVVPWRRRRRERRRGAVLATAAAAIALLANQPLAHAVDRERPYFAHPNGSHLLLARSHDPSFPSDHATGAVALALVVWWYERTAGAVLMGLAALLGLARVYAGTHYPMDVVGGGLIGALFGAAVLLRPARLRLERLADGCSAVLDRFARWPSRQGSP